MTAPARYARWDGVGIPFRLVDAPLPEPGPGEVLVAVDLATVCGSDLHTTRGRRPSPVPGVLGHEQVGHVVATAPGPRHVDGTPVRAGDRIVWSVAASCGRCLRCRRGIPQKCTDLHKYGHAPLDEARPFTGGFATHCLLAPGTATVVVPDPVPDAVAAPASCATATVAAVLEAAGSPGPGERVLVTGAGMLGVTAAAMAARAGAEVVVADPHPDRRERALRFGAAAAVDADAVAAGDRFDVACELSGAPAAVRTCLDALDVGGVAVLAGSVSPGPQVGLDPERLVRGLHTVVGVHNYAPRHLAAAVAFLAAEHDRAPFAGLAAGPWALADLDAAVAAAGRPGAAPRQAVRP
ncbi:alcohol dehydrogenase catalytic domain-containing protein [Pseudonocardia spirodelae]|uniref:alcohol dehydrogenase n=1 Tax=Pseudonocardia spirodelae TaxID=3133431 RepID=A0ABU8T7T0_9PSEU